VIFSKDDAKVRTFGLRMPSYRVLVNTAAPQGSTGITTGLQPSMTLGCGAIAGNITSDNIGPLHLINTKRIAYAIRTPEEAFAGDSAKAAVQAPQGIDRAALVSAVEKYLAAKGVSVSSQAIGAAVSKVVTAPAAAKPVVQPAASGTSAVAGVVDRFIARRGVRTAPAAAPNCGCALPPAPKTAQPSAAEPAKVSPAPTPAAPAPAPAPEPPKKAEVPAPKISIVDFVCEADVRTAMAQNKKIYIGPKTIVTPSAREVAARDEILVMAQR
jgi:acetaldehyde dehydrogenase (acetylating)